MARSSKEHRDEVDATVRIVVRNAARDPGEKQDRVRGARASLVAHKARQFWKKLAPVRQYTDLNDGEIRRALARLQRAGSITTYACFRGRDFIWTTQEEIDRAAMWAQADRDRRALEKHGDVESIREKIAGALFDLGREARQAKTPGDLAAALHQIEESWKAMRRLVA